MHGSLSAPLHQHKLFASHKVQNKTGHVQATALHNNCLCCQVFEFNTAVFSGGPNGQPAKTLWSLHEALEIMAATYCGTLAIEYKHLQQQDEMAWMEQRFESRQPLTASQKKKVN